MNSKKTALRQTNLTHIAVAIAIATGAFSAASAEIEQQKLNHINGETVNVGKAHQYIGDFKTCILAVHTTIQTACKELGEANYTEPTAFATFTDDTGAKLAAAKLLDKKSFDKTFQVLVQEGLIVLLDNYGDNLTDNLLGGVDGATSKIEIANLATGHKGFVVAAIESGLDVQMHLIGENWANFKSRFAALQMFYAQVDQTESGGITPLDQIDKIASTTGMKTGIKTGDTTIDKTIAAT